MEFVVIEYDTEVELTELNEPNTSNQQNDLINTINDTDLLQPVFESSWVEAIDLNTDALAASDNPWTTDVDNANLEVALYSFADIPDTAGAVSQINQDEMVFDGYNHITM